MKKFYLIFLPLFFGLLAQAQNISVADFYLAENDLTARTHGTSVEDQNGNICALIKVKTTEKGNWAFDVGMLGVRKTEDQNKMHPAEIWVYVPFSVTWISIQHDKLGELDHYVFPCSIDKGCTYVMKLTTGKVKIVVEEEVTQQYLLFQLDPPNATLEVNDKLWTVGADGTAMQYVDFGAYTYRVRAKDYHPEVGKVTVDDPENTKVVPVSLKPNFATVTFTVDADAEIWINNEKKGIRTWTGPLGSGTYKIECKQADHETSMVSKEISPAMNGQTITLSAPTPIYGSLNVESNPNMATLFIDGREVGKTPKSINEILVGEHKLRLTKEGYKDYVETIVIVKDERKLVKATLEDDSDPNEQNPDYYFQGLGRDYKEAVFSAIKRMNLLVHDTDFSDETQQPTIGLILRFYPGIEYGCDSIMVAIDGAIVVDGGAELVEKYKYFSNVNYSEIDDPLEPVRYYKPEKDSIREDQFDVYSIYTPIVDGIVGEHKLSVHGNEARCTCHFITDYFKWDDIHVLDDTVIEGRYHQVTISVSKQALYDRLVLILRSINRKYYVCDKEVFMNYLKNRFK